MNSIQGQARQNEEITDSLRAQRKQKEELQTTHEREMENLKASYSAEKAHATDRFESAAQNERLQHYENLRKLKHQISREERDLESRGKDAISDKTLRLQKEEIMADQEGRKRVESTMKKYAALEEYERQATQQANENARELRKMGSQQITEEAESSVEKMRIEKNDYLAGRKQNHSDALGGIEEHYRNLRETFEEQQREELTSLEERGFRELNQKRIDQAQAISLHSEKTTDPFYQLRRFESAMIDEGPSYRLNIKVPPHERKGLRIQANGQDVQIIGVRVSDQEAFEQGRSISTRTHQSFSEKISLDSPIDAKTITRTETDSGVEFKIQKLGASRNETKEPDPETRSNSRIAKQIRFSETLPSPSFSTPKSGKGTIS